MMKWKDQRIQFGLILLSVVGLIDSAYLAWIKVTGSTAICSGIGDCEAVNNSPYSELYGVPIAFLGGLFYLTIMGLLVLEWYRIIPGDWARYATFGLAMIGVLYSVYLTYLEVAVLEAICPFCVVSAVVAILLLAGTSIRIFQPDAED
jgi:uncharacterized membrane protein